MSLRSTDKYCEYVGPPKVEVWYIHFEALRPRLGRSWPPGLNLRIDYKRSAKLEREEKARKEGAQSQTLLSACAVSRNDSKGVKGWDSDLHGDVTITIPCLQIYARGVRSNVFD